jgi:hypothetical protein
MKLTKQQREVLAILRDDPDQDGVLLTWEKGGGWWIGLRTVGGKLARFLIQNMLVSEESDSRAGIYEVYSINGSGLRALDGLPPYQAADGTEHDSVDSLFAHKVKRPTAKGTKVKPS